jgi:hypothetical protein
MANLGNKKPKRFLDLATDAGKAAKLSQEDGRRGWKA